MHNITEFIITFLTHVHLYLSALSSIQLYYYTLFEAHMQETTKAQRTHCTVLMGTILITLPLFLPKVVWIKVW